MSTNYLQTLEARLRSGRLIDRREIGIRRALGANTANVTALVLRQGATLAGVGVGIGALITFLSTRAMQALPYGVKPFDPMSLLAGAMVLLVAAMLACVIPSTRASRSTQQQFCARNNGRAGAAR